MLIIRFKAAVKSAGGMIAGEHVMIGRSVARVTVGEGTHLRKTVHHLGRLLEMLAHAYAGKIRGNATERPAHVLRCIRFKIKRVDRAQAALEKYENKIGVVALELGLGGQQLRQRQIYPQRARCAHAQKVPPPNSVTIRSFHFSFLLHATILTLVIEDKFHRIQHRPGEVLGGLATLGSAAAEVLYRAFALGG